MTSREIREFRRKLCEIQKTPFEGSQGPLKTLMQKVGAENPTPGPDSWRDKSIKNIHAALQTETMINACNSAKWTCLLAAAAAMLSALSAAAAWINVVR